MIYYTKANLILDPENDIIQKKMKTSQRIFNGEINALKLSSFVQLILHFFNQYH